MERLARTKIRYQNQLAQAKEDMLKASKGEIAPGDIEELLKKAASRAGQKKHDNGYNSSSSSQHVNNNNNNYNSIQVQQQHSYHNSNSNGSAGVGAALAGMSLVSSSSVNGHNNNSSSRKSSSPSSVITSTGNSSMASSPIPIKNSPHHQQQLTAGIPTSVVVTNQAVAALMQGIKMEDDEDTTSDMNGEVIVELETGEDYDDETTTTASGNIIMTIQLGANSVIVRCFIECAEDPVRDLCPTRRGGGGANRFGVVVVEHAIHA